MFSVKEIEILSDGKPDASCVYEASVISSGNYARIAAAMRKAQRGEKVVLVSLGGSVTEGGDADPKAECGYVPLVFEWWKKTFPNAWFETINAGIGATGSIFGSARLERDVLVHKPDFVTVDFAVNDLSMKPYLYETFEGVVRRILSSNQQTGIMLLFMTSRTFTNVDVLHIPTGLHYDLPMISMKNGFRYMVEKCGTDIHELMGTSNYHPNNGGHSLMADLICHELEKIKTSLDTVPNDIPPLPQSLFNTRFGNAQLIGPKEITPVENEGWEVSNDLYFALKDGWTTAKSGAKLSFEVEASAIFVNFLERRDARGGLARVYLDGVEIETLENYFRWCGRIMQRLIFDGERSKHRVDIVFTGEPFQNGSGEFFDFFGLIIA